MSALRANSTRSPETTQKAPGRYTAGRLDSRLRGYDERMLGRSFRTAPGSFPYSGSFAKTMFTASSAEISPFSNPTSPRSHGRIEFATAPS